MVKYWISFSGGLGSAISVLLAHMNGLEYQAVFADTLIEDDDLYRFMSDIERVTGKEIIKLRDGRDPWQVFVDKRYIGNTRTAHCSQILKTEQVAKYLQKHAEPNDVLVLGMDYSEIDRIERAQENWKPREVCSLINDFKCWRPLWDNYFALYGLKKPKLYEYGFPHNNCGGFCVRAGLAQFATLLNNFPERYMFHENKQIEAMNKIGPTAKPFLRWTFKKVTYYLTLREFRILYLAGDIKVDPYDFGGCGCFVTDKVNAI